MNPDQKTRLLIGTLAAAVVIVVGYGIFQAQEEPPVQEIMEPAAAAAAASVQAAAPTAGTPVLQIQADSPVMVGSSGNKATATADTELVSYQWTLQGGTLEGDARSASITWTAGTGTEAVLICTGANRANQTGTTSLRVPLRQAPTISRFTGEPKVLTEGSSAKLSWSAENTGKLTLQPGGQDVTKLSGAPLEVKPERTTTYTLTATNSTGVEVTRELQIKVVAAPQVASFRAEPVPGSPEAYVVIGEFKNGKAELKRGGQILFTSEEGPLKMQLSDLKEGSSLVLTVTNEAGASLTSTLNFTTTKK